MTPRLISWPLVGATPERLAEPPAPKALGSLVPVWREALTAWRAPEPVHRALTALERPETAVIVTGQQTGAWGGPLYTAYKAATSVALARRLTASGQPAVAVFWMQGDDTDWDEAAWIAAPRRDLDLFRHRFADLRGPRRWIGSAPVALSEAAASEPGGWPEGIRVPGGPHDGRPVLLGDAFRELLLSLFGEDGLLPLDARWPQVRGAGLPLWRAYRERHADLARRVIDEGRRLPEAPIDAAAADHGLFALDEDRRREVVPEQWESEVDALLAAAEPERLAPSVLLRAPLQDYLFGSAAHVVGRAEAAYLAQIAPVYAGLGVRPPARVDRLRATLLPEGLVPRERVAEALADPESWIASRAAEGIPKDAQGALDALRRSVADGIGVATALAREVAKDFDELAASSSRKIDGELRRLEEALDRRARQILYKETPAYRHLSEFLKPRRAEQERGISTGALFFLLGDRSRECLRRLAEAHLDRLEEGTPHHFVLEIPHE